MSVIETPPVQAEPCTVTVPSTEADDVLRKMADAVRAGGWTRGTTCDTHDRRCTLGLIWKLG